MKIALTFFPENECTLKINVLVCGGNDRLNEHCIREPRSLVLSPSRSDLSNINLVFAQRDKQKNDKASGMIMAVRCSHNEETGNAEKNLIRT